MRTDNQFKRLEHESKLDALLENAINDGSVVVVNGRIQKSWIVEHVGCGQNWPTQNAYAKKKISEVEKKLREQGYKLSPRAMPGVKDKEVRIIMARLDRLEQRNALLLEENNRYKAKLYEYGWMDTDEEESVQGRLPW